MVPVLHAGTPHRVSLRGFERSHPQLVCVLIRENRQLSMRTAPTYARL